MANVTNHWRKSSFCNLSNCVEVASGADGSVLIRGGASGGDGGAVLRFTEEEWRAFAAGVRAGEFDLA